MGEQQGREGVFIMEEFYVKDFKEAIRYRIKLGKDVRIAGNYTIAKNQKQKEGKEEGKGKHK